MTEIVNSSFRADTREEAIKNLKVVWAKWFGIPEACVGVDLETVTHLQAPAFEKHGFAGNARVFEDHRYFVNADSGRPQCWNCGCSYENEEDRG